MATEIAITSAEPVTAAALQAAGADVVPDCGLLELRAGEVWVVLTPEGERLLTVYSSAPIEVATDAEVLLGHPLGSAAWWSVAALPHPAPQQGAPFVEALARLLDGEAQVLS